MSGYQLDEVAPRCQSLFRGAEAKDPRAFDDRGWIEATYTSDGRTVYALISNEYDLFRHQNAAERLHNTCHAQQYSPACMAYSINLAASSDGGRSFRYQEPGEAHVIAGTADPADIMARGSSTGNIDPSRPRGTPTVSNIVEHDGYFYAMVFARGTVHERDGNCLMRTADLGDVAKWLAWDGRDFSMRAVDVAADSAATPQCERVAGNILNWEVRSLTWHAPTKTYVGIMLAAAMNDMGNRIVGVYYATSPDLIHWSAARLLIEASNRLDHSCRPPIHYPVLLDPRSTSRNFETVGDTGYLYYTSYNVSGCSISLDRDLVRMPVAIR